MPQRIGREILQRLLEAIGVAFDDLRAGSDLNLEANAARRALAFVTRAHTVEQRWQRHRFVTERSAAPFELGQIKKIADDALEPMRFFVDDTVIESVST